MIKKTIQFRNLDGVMVTDTFYFHMNMMDAAKLSVSHGTDYPEHVRTIMGRNDPKEILSMFEELISWSVGRKSADGNYFDRSEEFTKRFMNSEAYTEFILELMQKPGAGTEFFNGVFPENFDERAKQFSDIQQASVANDQGLGARPAYSAIDESKLTLHSYGPHTQGLGTIESVTPVPEKKSLNEYSDEELLGMPEEEFNTVVGGKPMHKLPHRILQIAMRRRMNGGPVVDDRFPWEREGRTMPNEKEMTEMTEDEKQRFFGRLRTKDMTDGSTR